MSNNESLNVSVTPRPAGKGKCRKLRSSKMVPAVVYGPKTGNLSFSFSEIEADKYSKHKYDNVIFTLKSDDSGLNNLKVLRKDFDVHPVSRRPIHFDFYAIDMAQKVVVDVELRFDGKPAGAADGGLLNIISRNIEVECLPGNIPEFILVDVSGLGLDEALHASDLKMPENVKMITDGGLTLANCAVPKEESTTPTVAADPAAAAATATPAAPEKK